MLFNVNHLEWLLQSQNCREDSHQFIFVGLMSSDLPLFFLFIVCVFFLCYFICLFEGGVRGEGRWCAGASQPVHTACVLGKKSLWVGTQWEASCPARRQTLPFIITAYDHVWLQIYAKRDLYSLSSLIWVPEKTAVEMKFNQVKRSPFFPQVVSVCHLYD